MSGTQLPDLAYTDFVQNLLANFPASWTGDAAKQPGGAQYGLFASFGNELADQLENIQWVFDACRISSAEDMALDATSLDFFGTQLPRNLGEPDSLFRTRIQTTLLQPKVTRPAISNILTRLVGSAPRMIELWNPGDCGAYDTPCSYWEIDSPTTPFRYAAPELRYQALIESQLPSFSTAGQYPVYGYEAGAAYDKYNSAYFDTLPSWFVTANVLDQTINSVRALGVTVWRKYFAQALTNYMLGNTLTIAQSATSINIPLYPPIQGQYAVLMEPNWECDVSYINQTANGFTAIFSALAPPGGGSIDFLIVPISVAGSGVAYPTNQSTTFQIGIQAAFNGRPLVVKPNWNGACWISAITSSLATIKFANPVQPGGLISYLFPTSAEGGSATVPTASTQLSINLPGLVLPYQLLVTPSWNTTISEVKSTGSAVLHFTNPAPAGATVNYAFNQS